MKFEGKWPELLSFPASIRTNLVTQGSTGIHDWFQAAEVKGSLQGLYTELPMLEVP